uniref:Uncharacterized protein n=1 Tax=Chromera velia CCMP2878 TaxID=1169474 RepID=A0A0G4HBF5_9ALVE|eukprot:Cvel_25818.t1-p1 / transcript=Cvel_25818.t1 / gene=Cvel_25818 / organism=Chromera_velia_CCMP2878 / gene_product=hypothetical protein / transcript_product=hypothetical protein / location=Cvel_scaffold2977:12065-12601(+) / protein_length=179 / sequence_SO=supercontig / SO=protein_coding / is_pseudo=false
MRFSRAEEELEALTDRADVFLSGPAEDEETAPLFWRQARLLASKPLNPTETDPHIVGGGLFVTVAGPGCPCRPRGELLSFKHRGDLTCPSPGAVRPCADGFTGRVPFCLWWEGALLDVASKGLAPKCNDIPGRALVDLLFVFASLRHPCCDFERSAWKSLVVRVESLSASAISRMFTVC